MAISDGITEYLLLQDPVWVFSLHECIILHRAKVTQNMWRNLVTTHDSLCYADRPKLYKSVNVFIFFVNVCFLLETSAPFCSEILLLENGNLSCSVLYSSTSFVVILGYMCCNDQLILLQGVSFLKP